MPEVKYDTEKMAELMDKLAKDEASDRSSSRTRKQYLQTTT